jgi:hypothetical protein
MHSPSASSGPDCRVLVPEGSLPWHWAIEGGDAQEGPLKVYWDGKHAPGYAPMRKQGAIVLGIGGDNSDGSVGTFCEGAMTSLIRNHRQLDPSQHCCGWLWQSELVDCRAQTQSSPKYQPICPIEFTVGTVHAGGGASGALVAPQLASCVLNQGLIETGMVDWP